MAQTQRVITIFGASGFIGRQLLRHLSKTKSAENLTIRLASRFAAKSPPTVWEQLAPKVQNIHPVPCDISQPEQVSRALEGATDVVNCVGILFETPSKGATFQRVQQLGPTVISDVILGGNASVNNLVHMSAIGANPNSRSDYARTKAVGEEQALRLEKGSVARVTVLRPSIVFGPEDSFFNRFEDLSRFLPFLPLVGGGTTKFQPVHVENVADAIVKSLAMNESDPKTEGVYELGGKTVYTFRQLMEMVLKATNRRRLLLPIPFPLATIQGAAFETIHRLVPSVPPMLTRDQVELLKTDNVVSPGSKSLFDLGIEPAACSIDAIGYLR